MTLVVHAAPRARDLGDTIDGVVARDLVDVTRHLDRAGYPAADGFFGGRFGYGLNYEDPHGLFRMRVDCGGCGATACSDCSAEEDDRVKRPNFSIPGVVEVRWYKWIGRSMEVVPADLTIEEWDAAMAVVRASLPPAPPPRRIQRSRARGWRMPRHARAVSRPTAFGNPYRPNPSTPRKECVDLFERELLAGRLAFTVDDVRRELKGWDLACWCPLSTDGEPDVCHAAVLLEVANG